MFSLCAVLNALYVVKFIWKYQIALNHKSIILK